MVLGVRLALEGIPLDRHSHVGVGVVQRAVAGVVLAYRAIELVLREQAVHAFLARACGGLATADHPQPLARTQCAAANELAVGLHPADVRQVDAVRGH